MAVEDAVRILADIVFGNSPTSEADRVERMRAVSDALGDTEPDDDEDDEE